MRPHRDQAGGEATSHPASIADQIGASERAEYADSIHDAHHRA